MTLLDEVRRFLVDDARRRVGDPKPIYATAGAVDVAVDFVRALPERLEAAAERARTEWTPDRFGDVFTDLVDDVKDRADDAARRLELQRGLLTDPAAAFSAARRATGQAVEDARKAPGRIVVGVAEQAGAAFETYDDLAERGRSVLARLRGDAAPGETATAPADRGTTPVFRRPTSPTAPRTPPGPPPAGPDGGYAVPGDLDPVATTVEPDADRPAADPATAPEVSGLIRRPGPVPVPAATDAADPTHPTGGRAAGNAVTPRHVSDHATGATEPGPAGD